MLNHLFIVALGGALGASLRHGVNLAALRLAGPAFPWGTLAANVAGCFAMGIFVEVLGRGLGASQELRLFVATGVLGGFTTFSAFALDTAALWERGATAGAVAYAGASVIGSLAAIFLGLWLARSLA